MENMFRPASLLLLLATIIWGGMAATESVGDEAGTDGESHVLVLDFKNFTQVIAEHPFIVVEFYAPWCGHCKHLAPEYEKAAAALKSHDPPIVLAMVDANDETNKELASQYNVEGFPTLKIIEKQGAVVRDYNGPREADGIVSYLKRQAGPPSHEITSFEQGSKLVEETDMLVVGLFSSFDSEEFTNFSAIANELRSDYDFAHTLDASFLPSKDTAITPPTIRLFKNFDEGFNDLKEFSIDAVKKFLDDASIPYVVSFSKDPVQRAFLSKIFANPSASKALLFIDTKIDSFEDHNAAYLKVAQEYRGKGLNFIIIDVEEGQNALEYFGVNKEKLPTLLLQQANDKKFLLEGAKPSHFSAWIKDTLDGKVPEFYKSEPIPEVNDEPVKVLVRDSFDGMVVKSGKNVFIEFYAPWCGHCKRLAPILDEVAVHFQSDASIVITKFDATANDFADDRFKVEGFPTLYFYSASGNVTPYTGNRTKEDLIEFINKNKNSAEKGEVLKETAVESELLKDEL